MKQLTIPIQGMHCRSCELILENKLSAVSGVRKVSVSHTRGSADIFYHDQEPANQLLASAITQAGYRIGDPKKLPWFSRNADDYIYAAVGASMIVLLYLLFRLSGAADTLAHVAGSLGAATALTTGLVAGVSTCMALVGGLALGLSARHAELHPEATALQKFRPHLFFNAGRVIGFAILGALIGWLGFVLQPSPNFVAALTVAVSLVMLFLGLKLIKIFPVLTDKIITLPKSLARFLGIKKDTRAYSHTGAFITGALTFFLPCGFTQAMQLYAISTMNARQGALIMFLFALGTTPGLLGIGGLSAAVKGRFAKLFFAATGVAIITFALYNINNARALFSFTKVSPATNNEVTAQPLPVREIYMEQNSGGYYPNSFTVKAGERIKWIINSTNPYSCASFLIMPRYGIRQTLQAGKNVIEFDATAAGTIPFSCGMGMYRGQFNIIN
jgi:sulfite exporter TauE/SafE/copper chaperone CopZ